MLKLRILDSSYQMSRLFGKFISSDEYDQPHTSNGVYDIVFTHREIQDDFNSIKKYLKPTSKIVTDITTESGNIETFLQSYVKLVSENSYQFYLISDAIIYEYPNLLKDNLTLLNSHDISFYAFLNEYGDNMMDVNNNVFSEQHNGFMSLNNSCRLHRVYLLTQLLKRNISLENCSFLFSTGGPLGFKYDREVFLDSLNNLKDNNIIDDFLYKKTLEYDLPKVIDFDNRTPVYILNPINDIYKKCILNLVTENLTGMTHGDISNPYIITFTEKIIKPYLAKQIPIYFGLPGLLNILRKLGFDTFDDLIDNSYDLELDPIKRLELILTEVEKLVNLDLKKYKTDNKERFDLNYHLLKKLMKSGEEKIKSFLYEEILK